MVGAPATQDAIQRAKRLPELAVGLHVVLVHGRPVLEPNDVPDLVDERGEFLVDLVQAGVRFFFRAAARAQLEAEIRAQFDRFAATGLRLDHVNAQSHMHVHPTVFSAIVRVGQAYGLRALRIPREPFGGTRSIAPWLALMRARAIRKGLAVNDYVYGLNDVGAMTEERVLRILGALPAGVTEMFFHPATAAFAGADLGTERYAWPAELAALTSTAVRDAIALNAIANTTYGELQGRFQ